MEHRRTRRFQLDLPLSITRTGAVRVTQAGRTKNISSCGVLFTTGRQPDLGGSIEYVITLIHDGSRPVNIRCVGKVMRSAPTGDPLDQGRAGFEIAATLERYEFVRDRARVAALPQTG